jgi:hypothetical protein
MSVNECLSISRSFSLRVPLLACTALMDADLDSARALRTPANWGPSTLLGWSSSRAGSLGGRRPGECKAIRT